MKGQQYKKRRVQGTAISGKSLIRKSWGILFIIKSKPTSAAFLFVRCSEKREVFTEVCFQPNGMFPQVFPCTLAHPIPVFSAMPCWEAAVSSSSGLSSNMVMSWGRVLCRSGGKALATGKEQHDSLASCPSLLSEWPPMMAHHEPSIPSLSFPEMLPLCHVFRLGHLSG